MFMPDHFQEQWAPTVGLTIAVEATNRLVVGALVFDNDYRHPVVLAKEIATLDLASEGRVELGLGAGWLRTDYEASGIPYDRPGVRIERMSEALAVMKALWASDAPIDFEGEHYKIRGAIGTPRPSSRPHPKVCIGGGGRRVLSIAAREADIIGINATLTAGEIGPEAAASATPTAFDEKIDWVRDAAGERFDEIRAPVPLRVCDGGREPPCGRGVDGAGLRPECRRGARGAARARGDRRRAVRDRRGPPGPLRLHVLGGARRGDGGICAGGGAPGRALIPPRPGAGANS